QRVPSLGPGDDILERQGSFAGELCHLRPAAREEAVHNDCRSIGDAPGALRLGLKPKARFVEYLIRHRPRLNDRDFVFLIEEVGGALREVKRTHVLVSFRLVLIFINNRKLMVVAVVVEPPEAIVVALRRYEILDEGPRGSYSLDDCALVVGIEAPRRE